MCGALHREVAPWVILEMADSVFARMTNFFSGQAGAVRLGVARALEAYDPMLRPVLRSGNVVGVLRRR